MSGRERHDGCDGLGCSLTMPSCITLSTSNRRDAVQGIARSRAEPWESLCQDHPTVPCRRRWGCRAVGNRSIVGSSFLHSLPRRIAQWRCTNSTRTQFSGWTWFYFPSGGEEDDKAAWHMSFMSSVTVCIAPNTQRGRAASSARVRDPRIREINGFPRPRLISERMVCTQSSQSRWIRGGPQAGGALGSLHDGTYICIIKDQGYIKQGEEGRYERSRR